MIVFSIHHLVQGYESYGTGVNTGTLGTVHLPGTMIGVNVSYSGLSTYFILVDNKVGTKII